MPEMPEVESARRSFADRIAGAQVLAVRLGKPLRWPLQADPARLAGQPVGAVTRRGKYLWLALAGPGGGGLLLHLGMSGSLRFDADLGPPGPHDHFDLVTSHGTLRLTDPRRFGAVVWSASLDDDPAARLLRGLGVEPFDARFDGPLLHAAFRGRRVAVKLALLAGDVVVGAGNIYVCEALWQAGIDPRARAGSLSRPRCAKLADAVRGTLARALEMGGTTLRDFRDAHGMAGAFQSEAAVYGRAGAACLRCATPIRRIVQGQRATYFCPGCQKR
jgi:formamidopyrimidine-DNA glycosylase